MEAGMDPKEKLGKKRKENPSSDATEGAVKPIDGEEKEEKEIVELARKKMRLEVEVKKKEMNGLKQKKEAAFDKATQLCSELEEVQKFIDAEKESLEQLKREEKSSREKVESFELQIIELRRRIDAERSLELEKQLLVERSQNKISQKTKEEDILKRRYEEAKEELKKVEEAIVVLPSALGYSPDMLELLDKQIIAKRDELECFVCLEECSPPIYTCQAQHPICAHCR